MDRIRENGKNVVVVERGNEIFFYSYTLLVAIVSNELFNDYIKLTDAWDYSQTTLKQLYCFLQNYSTLRDENNNTIAYNLYNVPNKKQYIKDLIKRNKIQLIL